MGKKTEVYFNPTEYNRESWCYSIGDNNNSKKQLENQKKKQSLIAKKNIRLKK